MKRSSSTILNRFVFRTPINVNVKFGYKPQFRGFTSGKGKMSSALRIDSKKRLNSGYEIPLLGYGVCSLLYSHRIHILHS